MYPLTMKEVFSETTILKLLLWYRVTPGIYQINILSSYSSNLAMRIISHASSPVSKFSVETSVLGVGAYHLYGPVQFMCESVCENPSNIYQNQENQLKSAKRKSCCFNN